MAIIFGDEPGQMSSLRRTKTVSTRAPVVHCWMLVPISDLLKVYSERTPAVATKQVAAKFHDPACGTILYKVKLCRIESERLL